MNAKRGFFTDHGPIADPWEALRQAYQVWCGISIAETGTQFGQWRDVVAALSPDSTVTDSVVALLRFSSALADADTPDATRLLAPCCVPLPASGLYPQVILFRRKDTADITYGIELNPAERDGPAVWLYDADITEEELDPDDLDATIDEAQREYWASSRADFLLKIAIQECFIDGALGLGSCHDEEEEEFLAAAIPALGEPFRLGEIAIFEADGLLLAQHWSGMVGWQVDIVATSRSACDLIPVAIMDMIGLSVAEFDRHDWDG